MRPTIPRRALADILKKRPDDVVVRDFLVAATCANFADISKS